jgi:hypothetical protein
VVVEGEPGLKASSRLKMAMLIGTMTNDSLYARLSIL